MECEVKKMGKIRESETYVEIGGYLHQDQGRAKAKLYVGDVDKPLRIDDAELTKRMKKIRVTMNVSEDKSVHQNQVYEKDIEMVQTIVGEGGGKDGKGADYSKDATPEMNGHSPGETDIPAWGKVLKNFVDKISDGQTAMWIVLCGVAILAAVSLGLNLLG